jgi:hypothetical protein
MSWNGPPRRCLRRASLAAWAAVAALSVLTGTGRDAHARRGTRPLFEPTDLELEHPGVVEVDMQVGAIRSQGPARAVLPDVELDIGILRNLELDVDGAYAIEGPATGPFSFDHPAPDSLWVSAKIGFFDFEDEGASWAMGVQLGPKLPVAAGSHGVGGEALLLIGHAVGRTHLVLNAGAFADPAADATSPRPVGLELGLDLDQDIDAAGHWSLTGELSGVRFLSADPDQLLATAGFAYSPRETLEISIVGLWGFLAGSDRYGVLLGFSPKLHLF